MICPKCKGKLRTIDTVNTPDNEVYRRRHCKECGYEFYTIEFEAECDDNLQIIVINAVILAVRSSY